MACPVLAAAKMVKGKEITKAGAGKTAEKKASRTLPKSIVATINLHKRLHGVTFKRKAARAVSEIKKFASKTMGTTDVRVDSDLNKLVWAKGIRNVPYRVRVKLTRRRNTSDEGADSMYTVAEVAIGESARGQTTRKEEVSDE